MPRGSARIIAKKAQRTMMSSTMSNRS
jgi:hypothetical protein